LFLNQPNLRRRSGGQSAAADVELVTMRLRINSSDDCSTFT
jgi:hypothetical protein